jgi:L-ribulose-5-phosphate 3-epimerase
LAEALPFASGVAVQRYLPAESGLDSARDEGCTHWYIDASLPCDLPERWPEERRREVVLRAGEAGLTPIVHGNFRVAYATEVTELRKAALAYLETEIDLARDLGAAALIVHGGAHVEPRPSRRSREQALERFAEVFTEASGIAVERGVTLWLENLSHYPRHRPFSYVFARPSDFMKILQRAPDTAFILDVGHANVNQGQALPLLRSFSRSIAALSLSNNLGESDDHLPLDQGSLAPDELVVAILDRSWRGLLAFETRGAPVREGMAVLKRAWSTLQAGEPT